jgi:hypothetical protein
MLKPFRSNLGNGIILLGLTSRDTSKLHRITITKGAEELSVNLLLKTCCLLYLNSVN